MGCNFDTLIVPDSLICPLEEFNLWHEATYGQAADDVVPQSDLLPRLKTFRKVSERSERALRKTREYEPLTDIITLAPPCFARRRTPSPQTTQFWGLGKLTLASSTTRSSSSSCL